MPTTNIILSIQRYLRNHRKIEMNEAAADSFWQWTQTLVPVPLMPLGFIWVTSGACRSGFSFKNAIFQHNMVRFENKDTTVNSLKLFRRDQHSSVLHSCGFHTVNFTAQHFTAHLYLVPRVLTIGIIDTWYKVYTIQISLASTVLLEHCMGSQLLKTSTKRTSHNTKPQPFFAFLRLSWSYREASTQRSNLISIYK